MDEQDESGHKKNKVGKPDRAPLAGAASTPIPSAVKTVNLITFAPSLALRGDLRDAGLDTSFRRRLVRRCVILLGILAFFSLVLSLGPGLYRDFKARRASVLALQGEDFIAKNQVEKAIPSIRSAFMLSPDAPEVLRAMARLLSAYNAPDAMTYWHWILESKEATDDDRRTTADCAMHNGLYSEASAIIRELLARHGEDARNELLAARWSTQRGTPEETMHFAASAVNDNPTYKPAILFLAVQEMANKHLHQDGINSLFRLADSDDNFGLMALRCLALDPKLKPAEMDRLITRLHAHPFAGESERLAALTFEIKRHPSQRAMLIDQAEAEHQKAPPADLASFAEWLNSNGEAARVLKLIPRDQALSNKSIFIAYIDALGLLKRWEALKTLLTGATVPLELPIVELYLSRCSSEMGDDMSSEFHWQNAVSAASYNPSQSLNLAIYEEELGQKKRAADVYRNLTRDPLVARLAYQGLLRVLSDSDTRSRRDLLDQIVSRWPEDREMINEDIGLNLLLNERVPAMHARAVQILAEDSNSISHHTNVALACLRLKDPAGAWKAYDRISIDWNTAPVFDLIVYAATLSANGETRAAHRLLISVNRRALRPELRELIESIP